MFAKDERLPVPDLYLYPYCLIGYIKVYYLDAKEKPLFLGTGCLISKDVVLTCDHVLRDLSVDSHTKKII